MSFESLPSSLKDIKHVIFVGEGYSTRNSVLSYWIRYYAYKQGLSMVKTKEDLKFLLALEESLDNLKASETKRRIHNPVYAQNYLESVAIKLFLWAETQYRAEQHKKDSVLVFFTSALLLDICCFLFEDTRKEIIESKQYAKWRASQLQNCLITGEKPPQPAPTPTDEEMAEADSFVPTHGTEYVDLFHIKTMEMEAMKKSLLAQTRPKAKDDDEDSFLDYVDSGTDEVFEPEIKTQKNVSVGEAVRSILKNVVPTDPQKLLGQIDEIKNLIESEEQLSEVTRIIFEKAVQMPKFSPTYAQMCFALSTMEVESAEDSFDTVNFRKLLVTRCQQVFEKDTSDLEYIECKKKEIEQTSDEGKKEHLIDEFEGLVIKNRMRSLGNIRFFGELYKLRMIATKVMHICILRLLRQQEDEESLECLCILFLTIGKDLDSATKGSASGSRAAMNSYFLTLESIVQKRQVSNRTRFMIEDIIELRQNKWKKCRENMVLLQPFPGTDRQFSPCQTDGHFFL